MRLANSLLVLACCLGANAQSQPAPKPDISGITLDSKGAPLRKVDMILLPQKTNALGEPTPPFTLVSDREGKFEFYGVPPGRYRLMADHAGYLRTKYGAKTPWGEGTVLTLRPGVPITGLEVRLPEQAAIAGKVQDDSSESSLYLTLFQQKYQDGRRQMVAVASTTAERGGEFLFNKLTAGSYYLLVRPLPTGADQGADEEVPLPTYYRGATDPSTAEAITLKGGQRLSVEFAPKKSRVFRVGGLMSDVPPNGRAILMLRPQTDGNATSSSAATGPDGKFEFTRIPPGPYVLTASVPGAGTNRLVQQQLIDVHGDIAGLTLKPEPHPPLKGILKVEGEGRAIPKLRLMLTALTPSAFGNLGAQSGSDGSFTFATLPPGGYRIDLPDLPPETYLKSAKLGEKDVFSAVDLTQLAPEAQLELVISYSGAQVEGAIVDEQGKPAEGTAVLIPDPPQPNQPSLYKVVDSGDGGKFQFQAIRPGKYRLYAWEELEPGSHLDPQVTAGHEKSSVAIAVAENDKKTVSLQRIPVDAPPPGRPGGQ